MHRLLLFGATSLVALTLSGPASAWSWPADGDVLRPFTLGGDAYAAGQHRGIDVAGSDGSPVRAPASGTVSFAGSLPTYGRGLTILTSDGYAVTLVHLGSIGVAKGDAVAEGSSIGTMGSSGEAEHAVPSVHLGVRVAAEAEGYVDPLGLLPPRAVAPAQTPAPSPVPVTATAAAASPPPEAATPASPAPSPALPQATPTPVHATTGPARDPAPASAAADAAGAPTAPSSANRTLPTVVSSPTPTLGASDAASASSATTGRFPGSSGSSTSPRAAGLDQTVEDARSAPSSAVEAAAAAARTAVTAAAARPGREGMALGSGPSARDAGSTGVSPDLAADTSLVRPRSSVRSDGAGSVHPVGGRIAGAGDRDPLVRHHDSGRDGLLAATVAERVAHHVPVHSVGGAGAHDLEHPRRASRAAGGGRPATPVLVAAAALLVLLAAGVAARLARRIGADGAVLRHHADLLRQFHPAHRARLHDRGGGRLRTPSAAARS